MKTIRIQSEINTLQENLILNRRKVFRRAHYLVNRYGHSMSQALTQVWKEKREYKAKTEERLNYLYNQLSSAFTPEIPEKLSSKWLQESMANAVSKFGIESLGRLD